MYCEFVCCNDNGHLADIEPMCKYVIDACFKAGDTGIPNVSGRKSTAGRKCIPEKYIRKEKVAEHCHAKSAKNFWQCITRINTSGEYLPSKIDNEVDTQQIAENFGEKYRLLYTKVPTDPMEIETLSNILDSLCGNCNTVVR